jgi:hypothetical protein
MTAKAATDNLANLALNDLDFNVSDEEISAAKKAWMDSLSATVTDEYLAIKNVQHPM